MSLRQQLVAAKLGIKATKLQSKYKYTHHNILILDKYDKKKTLNVITLDLN